MDRKDNPLGDLSTHFWSKEFRCPCPKCRRIKVRVSQLLIFKLEMLRIALGDKPIIINSGNRCLEENERVGGASNSAHLTGEAADIRIKGIKPINIGLAAEKIKGLRIGLAKTYCHVDVRQPNPSKFWIYENNIIYSAKIENESLLKFYKIVTGKGGE